MSHTDGVALRTSIERALAQGGLPVERLGDAGTSVTFAVTGSAGDTVTLLLDRDMPVVSTNGDAEIRIEFDPARAAEFVRGALVLSTCLLDHRAHSWGPVRKYLAVDPILRGLLARVDGAAPTGAQ
ncbi:MAG: hypothetical protein ACYDHH_13360 [Solirubrobacteraceae bacterium]